jgi:hypothetical protein
VCERERERETEREERENWACTCAKISLVGYFWVSLWNFSLLGLLDKVMSNSRAGPQPHYRIHTVVTQISGSNHHCDDLPVFIEIYSLHGKRKILDDFQQIRNITALGNPVNPLWLPRPFEIRIRISELREFCRFIYRPGS